MTVRVWRSRGLVGYVGMKGMKKKKTKSTSIFLTGAEYMTRLNRKTAYWRNRHNIGKKELAMNELIFFQKSIR